MTAPRREAIAMVLIYHGTLAGGKCMCGYVYKLGESIAHHKADAVEAAIALNAAGMATEDIPAGVAAVLGMLAPVTP